ncbi:LVIVD repeat-containing protein [Reichenbachiella ulvae]|uniref:LVIVD repeat-containing protein n=1 Tax=Reichenbachiella ulvae TaxID=2980104 RepID=A0ABT3CYC4_9BACT|nr:hypothetical protein [Reichenbachiella ulvae]MCV9388701.1 hypothetical protein [Reichenbachiella ulvae]
MKTQSENLRKTKEWKRLILYGTLFMILLTLLGSCQENCDKPTYMHYEPIYAPLSEVRVTADFVGPQVLQSPGKLYYKDNHLFISEINKGIHVINNSIPSRPEKVGFIDLPGNKDLAAKGDFLYADNYMDLVILDISDKKNIKEVNRLEDVFNEYYYLNAETGEVLIDYNIEEREYDVECGEEIIMFETLDFSPINGGGSSGGTGVGGSMARFTIMDNYLYTINDWQMKLFDIHTLDSPIPGNEIQLGWGIETIFPYQDKLFLGARTGMHIYDNSNPELPTHVSTYSHVNACDPVVVSGDLAYVTLRSGTECETFSNQLDVIDISDIHQPELLVTHEMENPHGLGINGDCLFIAEGEYGLKLFNSSNPMTIGDQMIKHHKGVHAFDVIPLDNILFMVGEDGFYQYEYDCNDKLKLLSSIPF